MRGVARWTLAVLAAAPMSGLAQTKAGGEFRVNTYTRHNQVDASIVGSPDGGFVAVWRSDEQDGDALGVFGQRYEAFDEDNAPAAQGQKKRWSLHVGGSFADVPSSNGFYRFVETLLHQGVTAGCGGGSYCPGAPATREQMAVFVLVAREGAGPAPPACTTPVFDDVPAINATFGLTLYGP